MKLLREFVLYGIVSAVAFVADFTTLALLVEAGGWPYLPAAAIAFVFGSLIAWMLSVRYVFRYRRIDDRRVEAATFVVLGLAGLAANMALLAAGVEWLGLHYLLAKMAAGACTIFLNFALRRVVLFTRLADLAATLSRRRRA